jgi:hypothetical protein
MSHLLTGTMENRTATATGSAAGRCGILGVEPGGRMTPRREVNIR